MQFDQFENLAPTQDATTNVALRNDAISFPPGTLNAADTLQQYFDKSDPTYKQLSTQDTQSYDHIAQSMGKDNQLMSQYMSAVQSKVSLQLARQDWNAYGTAPDGKTLDKETTKQLLQFQKNEPPAEEQVNNELAKLRPQLISTAQKNGVKDINDKYLQNFEKTYFNEDKRSQELRTQLATKGANCTETSAKPPATTAGAVISPERHHAHHAEHYQRHGASSEMGRGDQQTEELNREELARIKGNNKAAEVQARPQAVQTQPQVAPEVAPAVIPPAAPDVWRSHLATWEMRTFGRQVYANVTNDQQRYQLDETLYSRYHGNQVTNPGGAAYNQYAGYNPYATGYNQYAGYNPYATSYNPYGAYNPYASPFSSFGLGNIGLSFGFGRPWGYNPWAYRPPIFYRRGFSIIL